MQRGILGKSATCSNSTAWHLHKNNPCVIFMENREPITRLGQAGTVMQIAPGKMM